MSPGTRRSVSRSAAVLEAPLEATADPAADPGVQSASFTVNPTTKKAPFRGLHEERMMGLEPTTFCMARNKREATGGDRRRQAA
jgi:hypothetical protein